MASAEENKAAIQRFLNEVMNGRNPNAADELCAPDILWHGGKVIGDRRGIDTLKEALGHLFTAFPDFQISSSRVIAEGDTVAAYHPWRGTHLGPFRGLPPTGRKVEVEGLSMYAMADGRVVEEWWQDDVMGLTQQLGMLPGPGQHGRPGPPGPPR